MRLRPSALPLSRFGWFSSVIPFFRCHSTPRQTIRVRQNVVNTCANYCNQAITPKKTRTGSGTAFLAPHFKMTGHLEWVQFFKLRRQSFCESHFEELFKRSFAFVDPRANQSAFPAIQNKRGKRASRKIPGDLPLCLCLGNDVRDHRRPSRKLLGNTGTNHLALLRK